MDLGLLVCAFGLSADQNGSLYLALVDRLVISDDEYAATLTGLECIVLQGKCYLDIGQPRRAWLAYRRGLVLGQLMVSTLWPWVLSIDVSRICTEIIETLSRRTIYGGHCIKVIVSSVSSLVYHTV